MYEGQNTRKKDDNKAPSTARTNHRTMKPHFPIFLLSRIVIVWLPYLGLQLYWQHLIATVPDAAHGELSGPVQFFLPVLFIAATLFSVVFIAGFYFTRPRSTRLSK